LLGDGGTIRDRAVGRRAGARTLRHTSPVDHDRIACCHLIGRVLQVRQAAATVPA
jgi:hypothetical protein